MEEANVSKRHSDAVLVAGINNMIVTDTTALLLLCIQHHSYEHAQYCRRMGRKHHYLQIHLVLCNPSLLLLAGQWLRASL